MLKLLPLLLIGFFLHQEAQAQCDTSFTSTISGATLQLRAGDSSIHKVHRWYFGDGTQAWGTPVFHTYNSPGTYLVKHFVTDSLTLCRDSAQRTITISFPVSCSASFVTGRDSSNPAKYRFTSTSTASGGSIQSYNWKVDDSTVSTAPVFSRLLPKGIHFVCLTIQTTAGCTSSVCDSIRVDSGRNCNFSASFTSTPVASNPSTISFTASPADSTLTYAWQFGDGQASSSQSPLHLYNNPGAYYVTLVVANATEHCYDSVSHYIFIQAPPRDTCTASFTYTANASQPNQLTFTAISNDTIVSQYWFIRPCDSLANPPTDSLVYHTPHPVHTFTNPGCYQVCLSLLTSSGCRKNYCDTLVMQNTGSRLLASFPNPAYGSDVNIQLNLEQAGKVKLAVVNSYGNVVYTIEKVYGAGQNRIGIPVDKLQRGLYFVDIQYGNIRKRSVFQKL